MLPPLMLITDGVLGDDDLALVVENVARALGSDSVVQVRDKVRPREAVRALSLRLREATARWGARLVVNGDVELARATGADGVHLGGGAMPVAACRAALGPSAWISTAAHDDDDVRRAMDEGATAALVSPIYETPGKGPPRGVAALASARGIASGTSLGLYALGGVTEGRAAPCVRAGANGVAVIRAVLQAPDPVFSARALRDEVRGAC